MTDIKKNDCEVWFFDRRYKVVTDSKDVLKQTDIMNWMDTPEDHCVVNVLSRGGTETSNAVPNSSNQARIHLRPNFMKPKECSANLAIRSFNELANIIDAYGDCETCY